MLCCAYIERRKERHRMAQRVSCGLAVKRPNLCIVLQAAAQTLSELAARLSDTMQHISNAQKQPQYTVHSLLRGSALTRTHSRDKANREIHTVAHMKSAIRQRVSFYCLADNCQALELAEKESRVHLLLCSIDSVPSAYIA